MPLFVQLIGFVSCYMFLMAFYGPKGIVKDLAPQAGYSLLIMTCTGMRVLWWCWWMLTVAVNIPCVSSPTAILSVNLWRC